MTGPGQIVVTRPLQIRTTVARCGHAALAPGCHVCAADQAQQRRPGRLRGKGWTKSPRRKKRRNRRKP